MRRRDFLTASALTAATLPFVSLSQLFAAEGGAKKILYYTRSQGFEHSPVKYDENGECVSAKTLQKLAKNLGYELVSTKDGSVFDDDLSQYAAFVFYTSGQLGIDPATGKLPEGVEAQARQALENLKAVLTAAGASLETVVKTTVFVKNMSDFKAVNAIYAEYFPQDCPARSCVEVAALPAGGLVEVEAIAVK